VKCSYLLNAVWPSKRPEGANRCRLNRPWAQGSESFSPGASLLGTNGLGASSPKSAMTQGQRYPEIDFNKKMSISTPVNAVRKGGSPSPFGSRCYIQGQNMAAWEPSLYCGNPNGGNLAARSQTILNLLLKKPGPVSILSIDSAWRYFIVSSRRARSGFWLGKRCRGRNDARVARCFVQPVCAC
jgi:hypothetical protein